VPWGTIRGVEALEAVIRLAEQMPGRYALGDLLQQIADGTAEILGVARVSVRLLDPARTRLLAVARAGQPLHSQPVDFRLGEGLLGWIAEQGLPLRLDDPEADARFAARPGMIEKMGAFLGVPIRAGTQVTGVISVVDNDLRFTAEHERLLTLIAAMCGPYVEIARLSQLSRHDPLTGSLNRRGLDASFPEVQGDADGLIEPLSVAMLDIDHFKRVNDELGHAAGDLVIRHVAATVGRVLRHHDAVVRFGGEEFLLVLPEVDRALAAPVAERARAAVERHPTPVGDNEVRVTVSIGVAERRPGEERDALIKRADDALYRAKRGGRNRVELAD